MTQLMGRAKKESMKDIMIVMKGLAEAQNKIDRKNLKAVTIQQQQEKRKVRAAKMGWKGGGTSKNSTTKLPIIERTSSN